MFKEKGKLDPNLLDEPSMAALYFAQMTVAVFERLPETGKNELQGRLRSRLKAETGFADLYLELDTAQCLMDQGYDVSFSDMEKTAQFNLEYSRGTFRAEVECNSISADTGRQIHRKDFYRFMHDIGSAIAEHARKYVPEVLKITMSRRLSANNADLVVLQKAAMQMLAENAPNVLRRAPFRIERFLFADCLSGIPLKDEAQIYSECKAVFGNDIHVSGVMSDSAGCLVVMSSERQDDTSKPLFLAMQKAAKQLSDDHPAFIMVQVQEIEANYRRRKCHILSFTSPDVRTCYHSLPR